MISGTVMPSNEETFLARDVYGLMRCEYGVAGGGPNLVERFNSGD